MMQKFNPKKTKYVKAANAVLSVFFHEKKAQTPLDLHHAKNILVIDAGRIGDIVMSIPFLKTLKRNAPGAKLTLVCGIWAEAVLKGQGLADRLLVMDPEASGSVAGMIRIYRQLRQINRICYDIALEPRGDLRYIFFMHWCNARRKVSYRYTGGECFLTDVVIPPEKAVHLVEDKLYFAKQTGCRVFRTDRYPKLSLTARQIKENEEFIQRHGLLEKQIIGIHPGAGLKIKQWDGFAKLAAKLAADSGHRAFLIFEGPGEKEAAQKTAQAVRACGGQALVSKTGLAQYLQRLALCHAVICNDSGAGHIARAYGVTVYVIFGPVEPAFARPYAEDRVFVFSDDSLDCKPCFQTSCPRIHEKGSGSGRTCFWKSGRKRGRCQKGRIHAADCECLKKVTVRQVYENIRLREYQAGRISD